MSSLSEKENRELFFDLNKLLGSSDKFLGLEMFGEYKLHDLSRYKVPVEFFTYTQMIFSNKLMFSNDLHIQSVQAFGRLYRTSKLLGFFQTFVEMDDLSTALINETYSRYFMLSLSNKETDKCFNINSMFSTLLNDPHYLIPKFVRAGEGQYMIDFYPIFIKFMEKNFAIRDVVPEKDIEGNVQRVRTDVEIIEKEENYFEKSLFSLGSLSDLVDLDTIKSLESL